MQFRLFYEGPLLASQRDPLGNQPHGKASHKHCIRRKFHKQIKFFWSEHAGLRNKTKEHNGATVPLQIALAETFQKFGYNFVPLVWPYLSAHCWLNILFLRRDMPGHALSAGDIDNRLKTIIDALRMPANPNELVGNDQPRDDEKPFFVLLENDNLVSQVTVETDTLLDPPDANNDPSYARLIITVQIKPYILNTFNIDWG